MAESLRDQLVANLEQIETKASETQAPIDKIDQETIAESERVGQVNNEAAVEADLNKEEKPGRTAGRPRDEQGRLLPGKPQKTTAAEPGKAPPAQTTTAQAHQAASAAEPVRKPYPTTWKKGFEKDWETLPQPILDEILRREGDYAKGVSTYKQEWENAKPLLEAINPYKDVIQAAGLQPAQWINELGTAHKLLTQGSPEQKLNTVLSIALNNGIDLQKLGERLFVRAQDGNLYLNPQLQARPPVQQAQQVQQPVDVTKAVRDVLLQERADMSLAEMKADTEKYPHFEQVRETMAGLLQSGLADDLKSAYEASLRLPKHSDLYETDQKQVREQEEARKREEAQAAAKRARASAVSPRSQTPTGQGKASDAKGLRATLEANADEIFANRV